MFELTFDLGPLHLRIALGDSPQDELGDTDGGGTYTTAERVDTYNESEVQLLGFRAP